MIALTMRALAEAARGRLDQVSDPDQLVPGPVVADSRQVVPGSLFVALPGERVDGHDYVGAAAAAGAVLALVDRPVGRPAVVVDDVLEALGHLARAVLDRLAGRPDGLRVVALTGSVGKTSTKDLLAALLAQAGETVAPPGSFNNELGVPLTVLRADDRTRFLLVEMGARSLGQIGYLCAIAPPSIGLVLNVGAAHAGEFGGRERTAQAKGELVEALAPDGVAVLNADDPWVAPMAARTRARVVTFGRSAAAQVRAEDVLLDGLARASFLLVTTGGRARVSLQLHGEHQVANALAAAAVALQVGLPLDRVATLLSSRTAGSRWRMEVSERADGVRVVNDAYNANPDSVRAALHALAAMSSGTRAWAVLGEMLELGQDSRAEHEAAGRLAAELGTSTVVAVGPGARPVVEGARAAGGQAFWVPDAEAAAVLLAQRLAPGDVVLVKASRSIGLDRLAATLLAADSAPAARTRHNLHGVSGSAARPAAQPGDSARTDDGKEVG